jgi:hypothetical protein
MKRSFLTVGATVAIAAVVAILSPAGTPTVAQAAAGSASAFTVAGVQKAHSQGRYLPAETLEEWCESHRSSACLIEEREGWGQLLG